MRIERRFKKIAKRMISVVICLTMLITTFCFFDIGSVLSEAVINHSQHDIAAAGASSSAFSTYTINAPELVYMKECGKTSMCFTNNTMSGNAIISTSNTGEFSFSCATAKSVSVSAKLYNSDFSGIVSDNYIKTVNFQNDSISGTSTSGTNSFTKAVPSISTQILSIELNNSAIDKEYIIEWQFTYTITVKGTDMTCITYAYTGVKFPALTQAGMVQYEYYNGTFTKATGQSAYSFIAGADYCDGGNAASGFVNASSVLTPDALISPLYAFVGTANDGTNYTMPTGKDVVNNTTYFPATTNGGVIRYYDNSSRSKVWYAPGDDSDQYNTSSLCALQGTTDYGNSTISIDSSRYNNFNQIPYLSCGYVQFFHHYQGAGNYLYNIRNCTYTTSDAASYWRDGKCTNTDTSKKIRTAATLYCDVDRSDESSGSDNRSYVRGLYKINGSIPTTSGVTYMRYEYMNGYSPTIGSNELCANVATVKLTYNVVDKSPVRKEYYKHLTSGVCNQLSNWNSYISSVRENVKQLCVSSRHIANACDMSTLITNAQKELKVKMETDVSAPVAFYVPEVVYLSPVSSSWGATTRATFQYFIQNKVNTSDILKNPTPNTLKSTSGEIYFSYANSSSAELSYRWVTTGNANIGTSGSNYISGSYNNITIGGTSVSSSSLTSSSSAKSVNMTYSGNYAKVSLGATSSYSPYLSDSTTGCYIEWTAKYVDSIDGYTKTAIAYTYVYMPYVLPVAGGQRVKNTNGNDHYGSQLTWLTGVHGSNNGGTYYARYTTSNYSFGLLPFLSDDSYANNESSYGNMLSCSLSALTEKSESATRMYSAFASYTTARSYFKANQSGSGYSNTSPDAWATTTLNATTTPSNSSTFNQKTVSYNNCDRNQEHLTSQLVTSAKGKLYIDTSRYTNLSQIPNLGVGLMVTDDQKSDSKSGSWYVADYTGLAHSGGTTSYTGKGDKETYWNDYKTIIARQGKYSERGPYETEGVKYSGAWPSDVLLPSYTQSTQLYEFKGMYSNYDGSYILNMIIIGMDATQYNKTNLRNAVNNAMANFAVLGIYNYNMNSLYYGGTQYDNFVKAYRNAYFALTKLDGEIDNPDTLATSLNSALESLLKGEGLLQGTARQYAVGLFKKPDGTYKIVGVNESENYTLTYTRRDNVYFTEDYYEGYTYLGTVKTTADFQYNNALGKIMSTVPTMYNSSNTYDSSCIISGDNISFNKNTNKSTAVPVFDTNDVTYNYSADDQYNLVYFYLVNGYKTYFNMNDGSSKVNLLGYENYNSTNMCYSDLFTVTSCGITASYNPTSNIITLNGTQTSSGGTFTYFPLNDVLKANTTYTFKFTYISGSKSVPSGQVSTITFDIFGKSGTQSYPAGTRASVSQTSNQSDQIESFTLTSAQAADVGGIKACNWLSDTSSGYSFNNYQIKVELTEGSGANTDFSPNAKFNYYSTGLGTMPNPTRKGYEFIGWYTAASGGDMVTGSSPTPSCDKTVYAHWKALEYNVLLDNEFNYNQFISQNCLSTISTRLRQMYDNWTCGSTGAVSGEFPNQSSINNPATATTVDDPTLGTYIHFDYERTAVPSGTDCFDRYMIRNITAPTTGTYSVEFDYRISNYSSKIQAEMNSTDGDSLILSLSQYSTGYFGNGAVRGTSYTENKTTSGGFHRQELSRSFTAGTEMCFELIGYFYSSPSTDEENTIKASIDIGRIRIYDKDKNLIWTSDMGQTSNGETVYNTATNALTISPTGNDCYTNTYGMSDYKMKLEAGKEYTLNYDFIVSGSDMSTRPMIFFFSADSGVGYTEAIDSSVHISNSTIGTFSAYFTVPSGLEYVAIRFGTLGATSGSMVIFNINVQRLNIFADNAYNSNVDLGGLSSFTDSQNNSYGKYCYKNDTESRWEKIENHYDNITYGDTYHSLDVPTREGYQFIGWFDANGTQYTSSTICKENNIKLYSRWTADIFTLVYNQNRPSNATGTLANVPPNQSLKYGVASNISSTVPTLTGWTFKGWYRSTDTSGSAVFQAGSTLSIDEIRYMYLHRTGDAYTIYAGWTANKITVIFDGNNSTSGSVASQEFTYDTPQTIRKNEYARSYNITYNENNPSGSDSNITLSTHSDIAKYSFVKWNNAASGSGTYSYNSGQENVLNPNGATSGTTNLYAQWEGGTVTLPTASKPGYNFVGWYTASIGGTLVGDAGATYTAKSNITLYAHWNAKSDTSYCVYVYIMDTSGVYPQSPTKMSYTGTTDTTVTVSASTYYPDVSGEFSLDTSKPNVLTGRITGDNGLELTVYIKRAHHTVTYDYKTNGGTSSPITSAEIYYQGVIDLSQEAIKNNWTFVGWNTSSSATTKLSSLTMGTANVTLYAIFSCAPKGRFYYLDGAEQKYVDVVGTTVYNNANTATISIPSISASPNINSLTWTKRGFTTAISYSGETVTLSGTFTVSNPTNAMVTDYYMCYSAIITLTHNASGGTLTGINPTSNSYMNAYAASTQTAVELKTQTPPKRDGYAFLGWGTSSGTTTINYQAEQTITGIKSNITLYAVWEDISSADVKVNNKDNYIQTNLNVLKGINVTNNSLAFTPIYEGSVNKYNESQFVTYTTAYTTYTNAKTTFNNSPTKANNDALLTAARNLINTAYPSENSIVKTFYSGTKGTGNFTISYSSGVTNKPITEGVHSLSEMNLNHYVNATLNNANDALGATYTKAIDQPYINSRVQTMALSLISKQNVKDQNPTYQVYETKESVENSGLITDTSNITSTRYVYSGKGNYTYYCYTNSITPTVLLTVNDIAGTNEQGVGRVCYPTKSTLVKSDTSNATAGLSMSATKVQNTKYDSYLANNIGVDQPNGKDYYKQKSLVTLTPSFTEDTNGTATYTIKSSDDSLVANFANTSTLSCKNETRKTATGSTDVTPPDTITIVIDYHQTTSESGHGNTFRADGDQTDGDKWLNQFHLFRTSGGANVWELPKQGDTVYTVDDSTYGQIDNGSFTYTFRLGSTNDFNSCTLKSAETSSVINSIKEQFDLMKSKAFEGANIGKKGLGYIGWNGNTWSFNYYPQNGSYTYVHLVDRWGNTFDDVVCVGLQDPLAPTGASTANGKIGIVEDGGSGISTMTFETQSINFVTGGDSSYKDGVYRTTGNTITLAMGEPNKTYNLSMTDKATNITKTNATTDANGRLKISVDDYKFDRNSPYTFTLNGIEINMYDGIERSIQKVDFEPALEGYNDYNVTVSGKPDKIRFLDPQMNTWTYNRNHSNVTIISYDESGNVVKDIDSKLSYEVWTIHVKMPCRKEMTAVAKFGVAFEQSIYGYRFTVTPLDPVPPVLDTKVYSMNLESTYGGKGGVNATVITGLDVKGMRLVMADGSTCTYSVDKAEHVDGKLVFKGRAFMVINGMNNIKVMINNDGTWERAGTLNYFVP